MITVKRIDHMGSDADIVAAARQSTDGAFRGWGTEEKPGDEKLLKYLWEHKHSTPFEFCSLHVEVSAPIFVARQVFRHRTFSFSEVSGRYVEIGEDVYAPKVWRGQGKTNRQGSAEPVAEQRDAAQAYALGVEAARAVYRHLLSLGVSREQARLVLPVSTMTRWRMAGNLRNWLAFLKLRLAPDVQDETRLVAENVAEIVAETWPRTWAIAGMA